MHTPVLLHEVLTAMEPKPGKRFIDATVGEGGHTKPLLKAGAIVLGIDRNPRQVARLKEAGLGGNLTLVEGNFSNIFHIAHTHGFDNVDGIIFDLGLSWEELKSSGKGLSYKATKEPLDMRLDGSLEEKASDILNLKTEAELYDLFARYSEEIKSAQIAQKVVEYRKRHRFETVGDLKKTIEAVTGPNTGKTLNRIFQSLRIAVNGEFDNLKAGLDGAVKLIDGKGKIAVIAFHSLEDRIVKQFVRERGLKGEGKKSIAGDRSLSFERPARLRIFSL